MTATLELDRIRWLIQHASRVTANDELPLLSGLKSWQLALLKEQQALRKRSRFRFPDPSVWLWTNQSLSQASDYWCARYKAALFPAGDRVLDACCGAGSDLVALASRGETRGIDLEPALAALAECNARAHGYQVPVEIAQLPAAWSGDVDWLHIDPDRRPMGTRTLDGERFSPSLESVLNMARDTRGAVIKLAPSTRMNEELHDRVEEQTQRLWLGNMGECRQQLLLTGDLIEDAAGKRRAVLSEPASSALGQRTEIEVQHYAGQPGMSVVESTPCRYVHDIHPVLHAADLQTAWASEQGLKYLGGVQGYFTSDMPIESKWTQCFEVIEVLAWDDRKVRKWLRGFGAGTVEVKCRLHRLDASLCQRRYSSAPGKPVTLLVTCMANRVQAIAARRLQPAEDAVGTGAIR